MSTILKNIPLSADLDLEYVRKDLVDILGGINTESPSAEELAAKLTDDDEHVPSSRLVKGILTDILARLKNIEVWMQEQWKETTLVIDNVDSIDKTEVDTFYLNTDPSEFDFADYSWTLNASDVVLQWDSEMQKYYYKDSSNNEYYLNFNQEDEKWVYQKLFVGVPTEFSYLERPKDSNKLPFNDTVVFTRNYVNN